MGTFRTKTLFQKQFLGSKLYDYAEFKTGLIINSIKVSFLSNSDLLKSQINDKEHKKIYLGQKLMPKNARNLPKFQN